MTTARVLELDTIELTQDGRVLTARVVSPPLNYATPTVLRDLDALTRMVDNDHTVGAVVLTGGVEGRFITHADPEALTELAAVPLPTLPLPAVELALRASDSLLRVPGLTRVAEKYGGALGRGAVWGHRWKKTILRMNRSRVVYLAAINGPAMGGGHEIALACDLRYTSDADDIRLGQFEILSCLIPGGGGTQRLPRMLGTAKALEHMLEGRTLTGPQALELGVIHHLVPADQLISETQHTAARLARRSPAAIRALKRAVYFGTDRPLARGLSQELAGFVAAGITPAGRRTAQAFADDVGTYGDTPFLANPEPWLLGTRVDQTRDTR